MMGRKTLGEIRAELEAALAHGAVLESGRGEVLESLRRFLGRESASAAKAGPDEDRGATATPRTMPTGPAPRRNGRRGSSPMGRTRRP
jgi:hypothetical protein